MPNYIYKVIFQDGSPDFFGGVNIQNSRWLEIPDRPIRRLEYFFFEGEGIILENFEAYLCFVEAGTELFGNIGNCPKCGRKAKISKLITKEENGNQKSTILARCQDMGTIKKETIEASGINYDEICKIILQYKLGECSQKEIWLTYTTKHLEIFNKIFVNKLEFLKLVKMAFDKRCGWIGSPTTLIYPNQKSRDKYIYIMGLKNEMVTSYRISLLEKVGDRYKIGDITKRVIKFGEEYNGRPTNKNLWKRGIV